MSNHPSARELVDAARNKQPSPQAQAVLDHFKNLPNDDEASKDASSGDNTSNPAGDGGDCHEPTSAPGQPAAKQTRKAKLLHLIDEKLAKAKSAKTARAKTKADSNRANGQNSTGPKTPEGKARVSANALKTGYFANVERLNPQDSPAYQDALSDLRMGLHPDGPVEEQLIRELAMFRARLLRLEAAEYALICADIETGPERTDGFVVRDQELDAREIATAFVNNAPALDHLHKAEVHLRRAYNRTWDRLERMQKERHKMPLDQALKQSQIWATYEATRTNRPQDIPARHPAIDEKGNLIKPKPGDPMYRPKKDEDNCKNDPETDHEHDQNSN